MPADTPPPSTAASEFTDADLDELDFLLRDWPMAPSVLMVQAADAIRWLRLSRLSAGEGGPLVAEAAALIREINEHDMRDIADESHRADWVTRGCLLIDKSRKMIERLSTEFQVYARSPSSQKVINDTWARTSNRQRTIIIELETQLETSRERITELEKLATVEAWDGLLRNLTDTKAKLAEAERRADNEAAMKATMQRALEGFRRAFVNDHKRSSLHDWNQRLKAADREAAIALGHSDATLNQETRYLESPLAADPSREG